MATERVVLVDETGTVIGSEERMEAHRLGLLHRAVSVFLFNSTGRLLLQRRAPAKALFPGKWANTCCTHARAGESVIETGERRLQEELGVQTSLSHLGVFVYRAVDPDSGLIEHELDHVLLGVSDDEPDPDPYEVDGIAWVDLDELSGSLAGSDGYAPWLREALRAFPDLGPLTSRRNGPLDNLHGGGGHE